MNPRALVVLGTRPEAIKLAPVVRAMLAGGIEPLVVSTGQHQEQLAQALAVCELDVDVDLRIRPGLPITDFVAEAMRGIGGLLRAERPDLVVVQGDTSSTLAGALAAFYERVNVAHVEAGLRTYDLAQPFPEEANRQLVGALARWHFAPTAAAARHLKNEVVPGRIFVTGNTGIDSMLWTAERHGLATTPAIERPFTVLVTVHRRENHGAPLLEVCAAVRELAARGDVRVVWPVHRNPVVREAVERELAGVAGVELVAPLEYADLLRLLFRARLVLTDSGGLQEEAPSARVPVLVLRETTERDEAVAAGVAQLVGTDRARIVAAASRLLDVPDAWRAMATGASPYGDGHAAERIVEALLTGWVSKPFEQVQTD